MTAPILRTEEHPSGGHVVTVGTRDFNQARMLAAPDTLGDSALRTVADRLYDWLATVRDKPRRRRKV